MNDTTTIAAAPKLRAYHGDPAIKEKYVARMKAHMAADELIQGSGWTKDGRGCAVGCTLDAYDHARFPVELGIPEQLAQLEDSIFEGLPPEEAMQLPLQFLEAIPVGADLALVWPKFAVWLLTDPVHGTIQYCDEQGKEATRQVAQLFNNTIAGIDISAAAWAAARAAAWDAAGDAAWAAARAAARAAAWAAAWDAAWAAAWDAAWDAAGDAARAAFHRAQRDFLLTLLAVCK